MLLLAICMLVLQVLAIQGRTQTYACMKGLLSWSLPKRESCVTSTHVIHVQYFHGLGGWAGEWATQWVRQLQTQPYRYSTDIETDIDTGVDTYVDI